MTQQKKNDNTQSNQGNPGNVGKGATGQTGQDIHKQKSGQGGGSQMGGKTSPVGGPETFESDQTNQAKGGQPGSTRTTPGGSQSVRDPYPPVNPDRPMMAGGQQGGSLSGGQNLQGSKGQGTSGGSPGGQTYGKTSGQGGNLGASPGGAIGSQAGAKGVGGTTGLEEEE